MLLIVLTLTNVIEGSSTSDDADNVLHIGGIFPIAGEGGWQGGQVSSDRFQVLTGRLRSVLISILSIDQEFHLLRKEMRQVKNIFSRLACQR